MSGESGASLVWYNASGSQVATGSQYTINVDPSLGLWQHTYSVVAVRNGCTSASLSVPVYVFPVNNSLSVSNGCGYSTLNNAMPAHAGLSWYWQLSATATTTAQGNAATYQATSPGTYYIRAYHTSGGWSPIAHAIAVNSINAAPTTPTLGQSLIRGHYGNYTLTVQDQGATYHWYNASGNPIGTGSSISVNLNAPTQPLNVFTVKAEQNGCWSTAQTAQVIVFKQPKITKEENCNGQSYLRYFVDYLIDANTGDTTTMAGRTPTVATDGFTYYWQTTANGEDMGNNAHESLMSAGTYYLRPYGGASVGWGLASAPVQLLVKNTPAEPQLVSEAIFLGEGSHTISLVPTAGVTYEWYAESDLNTRLATGNSYTFYASNTVLNDPTEGGVWTRSYVVKAVSQGCERSKTIVTKVFADQVTLVETPMCDSTQLSYVYANVNPAIAWHWQSTPTGTDLTQPAQIYTSEPNTFYLRLHHSQYGWAPAKAITVTEVVKTPVAPSLAPSFEFMGTGNHTLSVVNPDPRYLYVWYNAALQPIDTTTGSYTVAVSNITGNQWQGNYRVAAFPALLPHCISPVSPATQVTVYQTPRLTFVNNNPYLFEGAVTLQEVNTTAGFYDTYVWKQRNPATNTWQVASADALVPNAGGNQAVASKLGDYLLEVTKNGLVAQSNYLTVLDRAPLHSQNLNYITTRKVLVKQTDPTKVANMDIGQISESTTYFDGLGRPTQSVGTQASPDRKDVVQPIDYDPLGRTLKQYLPYTGNTNGFYKNDALSAQKSFYNKAGQGYQTTQYAYSQQVVEPSPLNRVTKQMAPGASWVGNQQGVSTEYLYNGLDQVRILTTNNDASLADLTSKNLSAVHVVNASNSSTTTHEATEKIVLEEGTSLSAPTTLWLHPGNDTNHPIANQGYYAPNTLVGVQVRDEDGKISQEFKNQSGQVILKRALVDATQTIDTISYQDTVHRQVREVVDSTQLTYREMVSSQVLKDSAYTHYYGASVGGTGFSGTTPIRERVILKHIQAYTFKTDWQTGQILDTTHKSIRKELITSMENSGKFTQYIIERQTFTQDTVLPTLPTVELDTNHVNTAYIYGNITKVDTTQHQRLVDRSAYAETYYVYDHFGNLSYVLPPEASKLLQANDWDMGHAAVVAGLPKLWYRYYYDQRQRLIVKEVPGAGKTSMVYDPMDRLVLSQDANQGNAGKWSFTKYDQLNRPVMTGLYASGQSREALQTALDAQFRQSDGFRQNEHFDPSLTAQHLYTNVAFPNTDLDLHSVTYYDNYDWQTALSGYGLSRKFDSLATEPLATNTQGQVTATKTAVLDAYGAHVRWLHTVSYYDQRGRVMQTVADNHKGGKDLTATQYDFAGRVLQSVVQHHTPGNAGTAYLVYQWTDYDHTGRVLETYQQISQDTVFNYRSLAQAKGIAEPISKLAYNTKGELIAKRLAEKPGKTALQTLNFRYNIRGWMTHLNDAGLSTQSSDGDIFGFELKYDQGATNNYLNGNIGRMVWQSSLDNVQRQYDYTYDMLNRLKTAKYSASDPTENGRYDVGNLSYDLNGNILTLRREGLLERDLNLAKTFGTIDQLSYTYAGNQLLGVADAEDSRNTGVAGDFRDGHIATTQNPDYRYDANGNMIADQNKGIVSIVYNHLNLPTIINFEKNQQIVYTYDAAGIKLNKVVYDSTGAQLSRTDYVGSFVYENDALQFVHTGEGRALAPGTLEGNPDFVYEYHYKDHLGNLRVAFREGQAQTTQATLEDVTVDKQQGFEYKDEIRATDPTNGSNHVAKLTTAQPLGMLRNLEVSKGDQITVRVKGYYAGAPTNNQAIDWGVVLSNLSQSGGDANSGEISSKNSPFLLNLGLSITPNGGNPDNAVPSGYLKSVFYKHDGTPVVASLKLKHLQAGAGQWQTLELSYTAPDRGYVQIFVANESDQTIYFDDLEVEHTPQLIVQENHYYPFGMNLAGIEKVGKPEHRWKFGGKEFDKTFGLNWGDFESRRFDPVLGRWFVIDPKVEEFYDATPYNYALNNPIRMIDPDGKAPLDHIYVDAKTGRVTGRTKAPGEHRMFVVNRAHGTNSVVGEKYVSSDYYQQRLSKAKIGQKIISPTRQDRNAQEIKRAQGERAALRKRFWSRTMQVAEGLEGVSSVLGAAGVFKGIIRFGVKKYLKILAKRSGKKSGLWSSKHGRAVKRLDKARELVTKAKSSGKFDADEIGNMSNMLQETAKQFRTSQKQLRRLRGYNKEFQKAVNEGINPEFYQKLIDANNATMNNIKRAMTEDATYLNLVEMLLKGRGIK